MALALDRDERIVYELHDLVISHLFGSAMGPASVLNRNRLDDEDSPRPATSMRSEENCPDDTPMPAHSNHEKSTPLCGCQ